MKKHKNIVVITSGGDVPGLNACIRAIVRTASYHNINVIGIQHGFMGMIRGDFINLDAMSVSNIIQTGGTILKTSRSIEFFTKKGRAQAYQKLKDANVDAAILIGGDGSFEGAKAFTKEYTIPFVCIPKTIDNDISGTEICIGYDTALNTAMQAIDKIRDTASSHERIFVVEVMGRKAGYIAYGVGIATGAEAVLIPETEADFEGLKQLLIKGWKRDKSSLIIVVAEGDESGGAYKTAEFVKQHLPGESVRVSVLGHIQRGGSPSAADRILASRFGYEAVNAVLQSKKNVMIGMLKNEICFTDLTEITNKTLESTSETLLMLHVLAS